MSNEHKRPCKPSGRGKQVAGIVLFWIGIEFLIIGIILGAITSGLGNDDLGLGLAFVTAVSVFVISCLFLLIGIILYFVGRSQAKRAQKQNSSLV